MRESATEKLIYNVGAGRGYSVRELARACQQATAVPFPVHEHPRRAGDPPYVVGDARLIFQELGWWASEAHTAHSACIFPFTCTAYVCVSANRLPPAPRVLEGLGEIGMRCPPATHTHSPPATHTHTCTAYMCRLCVCRRRASHTNLTESLEHAWRWRQAIRADHHHHVKDPATTITPIRTPDHPKLFIPTADQIAARGLRGEKRVRKQKG